MLVLSRNEGQGITFPDLDLEVKIIRITGNRIQVGVDASPQIRALRTELVVSDLRATKTTSHAEDALSYEVQTQINVLRKTLDLAQRQLDRGDPNRATLTLEPFVPLQDTITKVSEAIATYTRGSLPPERTVPEILAC